MGGCICCVSLFVLYIIMCSYNVQNVDGRSVMCYVDGESSLRVVEYFAVVKLEHETRRNDNRRMSVCRR